MFTTVMCKLHKYVHTLEIEFTSMVPSIAKAEMSLEINHVAGTNITNS